MRVLERQAARSWCQCASVVVALCATVVSHATGASFATVLGGSGQDYAASVVSDSTGNTYIAGLTYSPDLHVTPGAFQTTIGGNGTLSNPYSIAGDAFVAKFGPDGTLLWSTFLGGSGTDYATGVGVDSGGNVLVTGAPAAVQTPTVTVGGVAVPVRSVVLTVGSAGLYQVTIQLPASVPTGSVAIQASAGGARSAAGITIFIGRS